MRRKRTMREQLPGSSVLESGGRFRAVLIQEGRSKNGNVWTKPVLEQIAAASEGAPVNVYDFSPDGSKRYLHHWEALRRGLPPAIQRLLPEHLRDAQVATVRNPRVEDAAGKARVVADLEPSANRGGLLSELLEASRRLARALGLSIHLPIDGFQCRPLDNGDREPTTVSRVVGYDVVSFPSAGGRIVPVLEALARRKPMKNLLQRLLRLVPEKSRAQLEALFPEKPIDSAKPLLEDEHDDLREAVVEALGLPEDLEGDALVQVLESLAKFDPPEPRPDKRKTKKRADEDLVEDEDDEEDDESSDDDSRVQHRVRGLEAWKKRHDARMAKLELERGTELIDAVLESSKLPKKLREFAGKQLAAMLESAGTISRGSIKEFLEGLTKGLGGTERITSLLEGEEKKPRPRFGQPYTTGDRVEAALEALISGERFGIVKDGDSEVKVPAFHGIKQAYQVITGDMLCEGLGYVRSRRRASDILESIDWEREDLRPFLPAFSVAGLEATILTTGFVALLSNVINKRMMRDYAMLPHLWRMVARTTPVNDFKSRSIVRFGEFANLPTVAQDAAYVDLGLPTEDEVTASIVKHGGLGPISWESIVNDDTRTFRSIPGRMARAAERTLNVAVWGKLLNNGNYGGDGVAIFHATHANLGTVAYSFTELSIARRAMTRQKDIDAREAGVVTSRNIFCGPLNYDAVYADVFSDGKPNLVDTDTNQAAGTAKTITRESERKANVIRSKHGLSLFEVHEFDSVANRDNDVIVAASPDETEVIEVGFLQGREEPEIFIQDLDRVGTFFTNDRVTYKVRHVHDDGVVVDYRGLYLIQSP